MTDLDLNALAASLADTARHLDEAIERRAREIAEPRILAVQLDAKTRMDAQDRETRFEMQRKSDLIAELRRQLNAHELWFEEIKDPREADYASECLAETAADLVKANPRLKGAFKSGSA